MSRRTTDFRWSVGRCCCRCGDWIPSRRRQPPTALDGIRDSHSVIPQNTLPEYARQLASDTNRHAPVFSIYPPTPPSPFCPSRSQKGSDGEKRKREISGTPPINRHQSLMLKG
uniref:Uncharacterized protein n=1 Tax=Chromera velia CCMP2878 TaxID=1169474 RepID=A0A0G4I9L9_9ALVE|eukprot:Cvel_2059.t1-p1 / transcript=Cvel_2059.t1 / gene=Cvel_2059 / organism=Chromera_velia_CCMP2878 / gene_product=hypothetical protein / transcript_product=hypothetical protein / location=Cvel_scaffold79:80568-80903(-) / protein_length=112 / sequence_SO=supercontig / SO=protein_coding / is_pseudo=false